MSDCVNKLAFNAEIILWIVKCLLVEELYSCGYQLKSFYYLDLEIVQNLFTSLKMQTKQALR
jgi:hypothetical protein